MSSTSPVLADARLRGHRRQELAHVSKTDEITHHHAIRYEPINYTRPPDSARNTAARDRISIIAFVRSRTSVLSQLAWRIRKRPGSAGSRSTTWIGVQAHCQTLMPGVRENWICPRVPSTETRGQDSAVRVRSTP